MLHYNDFCCHFHSFNRDSSKRYWCCEDRRICNAQCTTSQDLDNITVIQDGKGKCQNTGIEGGVRKTLHKLKRHAEEPNVTPSQVLQGTRHDIHDE